MTLFLKIKRFNTIIIEIFVAAVGNGAYAGEENPIFGEFGAVASADH